MSNLSQFFGSGGGASNFIRAQVLVAAGGGGHSGGPTGGGGGAGGLFYDFVEIEPGSTCPVVIGAGGPGASPISDGSPSTFTTPTGTIFVMGGGGGGSRDGGSGGGCTGGGSLRTGGNSVYSSATVLTPSLLYFSPTGVPIGSWNYSSTTNNNFRHTNGFFGSPGVSNYAPATGGTVPGTAGGGASTSLEDLSFYPGLAKRTSGNGMYLDIIAGSINYYCEGGVSFVPFSHRSPAATANTGHGGSGEVDGPPNAGQSGGSGVVIVRYPTQFGAAPSYPGATDLTPTTSPFGFRTYKFTSPGSITLP